MTAEERLEHPAPADRSDVPSPAPGQTDALLLTAIMRIERDLGRMEAKLDRVLIDQGAHGSQLDDLTHKVSFVRGMLFAIGAVIAAASWLVANTILPLVTITPASS